MSRRLVQRGPFTLPPGRRRTEGSAVLSITNLMEAQGQSRDFDRAGDASLADAAGDALARGAVRGARLGGAVRRRPRDIAERHIGDGDLRSSNARV